jgi:hypothetical protein
VTKKERRIEILEIGDPENCPGCRKMESYLRDLTGQYSDASFDLIPFSFARKNSEKNVKKVRELYGKLPRSIPVVIIKNENEVHIFDGDSGFDGIEDLI